MKTSLASILVFALLLAVGCNGSKATPSSQNRAESPSEQMPIGAGTVRPLDRSEVIGDNKIPLPSNKTDIDLIQGIWRIDKFDSTNTSGKVDGGVDVDEFKKSLALEIKGDRIIVTTGGEKTKLYCLLQINQNTSPKSFDLTECDQDGSPLTDKNGPLGKVPTLYGIYKLERSELIVAAPNVRGGKRPTEFKALPQRPMDYPVVVVHLKKP